MSFIQSEMQSLLWYPDSTRLSLLPGVLSNSSCYRKRPDFNRTDLLSKLNDLHLIPTLEADYWELNLILNWATLWVQNVHNFHYLQVVGQSEQQENILFNKQDDVKRPYSCYQKSWLEVVWCEYIWQRLVNCGKDHKLLQFLIIFNYTHKH
jgi:hypothetical protein